MPARRRASATMATCLPRRAARRRAQVQRASAAGGRRRIIEERGLNEQPAGVRVPNLGDGAAALGVTGAGLAGHEAEVGLEVMGVAEALRIVDRGDEGGGGDGAE